MNEKSHKRLISITLLLFSLVSSAAFSVPPLNEAEVDRYIKKCYPSLIKKLNRGPIKVEYGTKSGETNWVDAEYDEEFKAITIRTGLPHLKTKGGSPFARFGDLDLDGILDSAAYFDGHEFHNESSTNIDPPISNQSYFMWKISLGIILKESGVCI